MTPAPLIRPAALALAAFTALWPMAARADSWSMVVREVSVDGKLWKWNGELAARLGLKVGSPYRPGDGARAVNLLQRTGNFKSVDLAVSFAADGVRVRFELVPLELVSAVNIRGNFQMLKKDIRAVLRTVPQEVLDLEKARQDVERIRELYERYGFIGTKISLETRPDREGWGVEVDMVVKEGEPAVIQRAVVRGNKSLTAGELADQLQLLPFTFYSPEKVEAALQRILEHYRQAGFIEVKAEAQTAHTRGLSLPSLSITHPLKSLTSLLPGEYVGVDVVFNVEEGEKFDIVLAGNHEVPDRNLRKLISFYQSGFFDQYEAQESGDEMLSYYRNNGFYLASVETQFDREKKTARFVIKEGPLVKIGDILFEGNTTFSGRTLRGLMDSAPGTIRRHVYRAEALANDINKIRAFYLSRGFTRVAVNMGEASLNRDRDRLTLAIIVEEGPRTAVSGISFSGNTVFDQAGLAAAAGRPASGYFNPEWVEQAKRGILDQYSRLGFSDCTVNADLLFTPDGREVSAAFHLREGTQHRLGSVLVEGNRKTRASVVTREIAMAEEDPYDPIKLYEGKQRLYEMGLFSRIDLEPLSLPGTGETDLLVKVRERETGRLSVGLGYDSAELYRGFVEIGENNLWGTARGARLRAKFSSRGRRYDLVYKEPWFLGFHQDVNLNLYDEFKEEPGYDLRRLGGKLFSERKLARYLELYTAYRYESVDYSRVDEELLQEEVLPDVFRISSLQFRLAWDHRDNPINPHRGEHLSGGMEVASPLLGSQAHYNKYDLAANYVQPVGSRTEIIVSARLGLAQRLTSGDRIPLSERFFAGGASTVRGYAEKGLGPKDADGNPLGGELMVVGNVEWRFRIYGEFGGVVFFDAGQVWREMGDFGWADFRESVGAGLRYETPVGPARLEYGQKLHPEPGEGHYRIHFTLGHPF